MNNIDSMTPSALTVNAPDSAAPNDAANSLAPSADEDKFTEIARRLRALAEKHSTDIEIDLAIQKLQKEFDVGKRLLQAEYAKQAHKLCAEQASAAVQAIPEPTAEEIAAAEESDRLKQERRRQVSAAVKQLQAATNLLPVFHSQLEAMGYICKETIAASIWLSHGSRLLPDSTAFYFSGSSASGKSAGLVRGAELLPPEIVMSITSMSEKALSYIGSMKNMYVMFGEMAPPVDGQDDFIQRSVRQLLSENKITHCTVEKADGKSNQQVIRITEGPCVMVGTTTKDPKSFNDELQNRAVWVPSDDSTEITSRVVASMARRAANPIQASDPQVELMKEVFQNFHQTLESLTVVIPFADRIRPQNDHVTVRRLYPMTLSLVKASALLHQHSRQQVVLNGTRAVEATVEDYKVAYRVLAAGAPRVLERCPKKAREVFDNVIKPAMKTEGKALSTTQIQKMIKHPGSTVSRWLKDFVEAGLLVCLDAKWGKQNMYFLVEDGASEHLTQELGLVPPEQLCIPTCIADLL